MAAYHKVEVSLNTNAVEVGVPSPQTVTVTLPNIGPQGPQGPAGASQADVLTVQGDLLYRGVSAAARLPIGSAGQVLKVTNGLPAWGNESGAVTSVNGETGAVTLDAADVGAAETLHATEHQDGEADQIMASAVIVDTEDASLNGVYVPDGTTSGGRLVYYRPGTRKNTKLQYNTTANVWYLIKNTFQILEGQESNAINPWTPQQWIDIRSPQGLPNGGTITQASLEKLARSATENLGTAALADTTDLVPTTRTISAGTGLSGGGDLTANRTLSVAFGNSAGTAAEGNDARLSDARTPTAHKSTHATGGTDALAPSDIGAQSIFVTEDLGTITANVTLTAARAKIYTVNTTTSGLRILLPTTGVMAGDVVIIEFLSSTGQTLTPMRGSISSGFFTDNLRPADRATFIAASTSATSWYEDRTISRFAAEAIFSGTVDVARLPVGTGSTQVAAGNHIHVVADVTGAAASGSITTSGLTQATARLIGRTSSGVGAPEELSATDVRTFLNVADGAEVNVQADWNASSGDAQILNKPTLGTAAAAATTDFAAASHTHAQLHDRSHAMTGTSDHTATAWRVFYSNGSGQVTELALGAANTVLTSNGASSAPSFTAAASGGTKTYAAFTASDNQPPSTSFATLDTRNSISVLDFDDASTESAVFVGVIPEGASLGSGLIVNLDFMATTATSGNVRWSVAFERCTTDLDSDSFDTATAATVAVASTSGIVAVGSITCTAIDGITAGDLFRIRIQRLGGDAADSASGDIELVGVEIRSAA